MKSLIRKNIVSFLANIVLILIVISTILVVHNRAIIIKATEQQEFIEKTLIKADLILNNLQTIDLGLRAYAITQSENHLGYFKQATGETKYVFDSLEYLLNVQGFKSKNFPMLKEALEDYIVTCNHIVVAINLGQDSVVREMIIQDNGFEARNLYQIFFKELEKYERQLSEAAQNDFDNASSGSIWMMIILFIVSAPSIYYIIFLLRSANKKRIQMFKELEQNNRRYNFDPGTEIEISNEYQLINEYINNSKRAANFVSQITEGEFNVHWEGMNDENRKLNQENLAGALIKMRDQMKSVKEEEERRLWLTKGQAQFSEIVRNHQENIKSLAYESVVFLVKYLGAQQGGMFLVREDNDKLKYLELTACYAFERKKFIKKRIEPGEGLVGQAYLEGLTTFLMDIPQDHVKITSGLGDSTPKCLLIVPMKYNGEVHAIIEIASFCSYESYQIEFLEKLGEFVASAVFTVQTNEVTKQLLVEAQQMTEEMKAQEEDVRQNMEEITATQEEMYRKEKEYIERINHLEGMLARQPEISSESENE